MPPIEFGPALPVGAVDTRALRAAKSGNARSEKSASPSASPPAGVVASDVLDPGAPPVDTERVALIRRAVETGAYPILPAKVAEAMIAAGRLLRTPR